MTKEPERHPSYGLLQISRVQGDVGPLFGSAIEHQHFIRLRVKRATLHRELYHDRYHDDLLPIVEVDMSPVQFAEAITSLNMGCGVPCTIRQVEGQDIPEPDFKSQREQFRDEFKQKCQGVVDQLDDLLSVVETIAAKPGHINKNERAAITTALGRLRMELGSNLPFIHESFDEAVDKTVAHAKGEVEAFFHNAVMQAGKQALAAPRLPMLEGPDEKP